MIFDDSLLDGMVVPSIGSLVLGPGNLTQHSVYILHHIIRNILYMIRESAVVSERNSKCSGTRIEISSCADVSLRRRNFLSKFGTLLETQNDWLASIQVLNLLPFRQSTDI